MSNLVHRIGAVLGTLAAVGPSVIGNAAPPWAKLLIQAAGAVALLLADKNKVVPRAAAPIK